MGTSERRAAPTAARLPRLAMNGPLLRGSGELHIVGPREVVTIADRDGVVHRLLALADGSRSPQEIFAALATNHPLLGEQEVLEALSELEDAGLIEDCMPRRSRAGCNLRPWGVESGLSRSTLLQ
jgi:hypothetical protein